MKKYIFRVILAVILCFSLIYPLADPVIKVFAEEVKTDQPGQPGPAPEDPELSLTEPAMPPEPDEPEAREPELSDPPSAGLELVSIEDEFTVTYKGPKGSYTTWFTSKRQAFEGEDGTLRLFDNTLEEQPISTGTSYYENADADYTAVFPETITDAEGVSFEKDGNLIELIPLAGDFSRSLAKENAIRYTEVQPGIDYQYSLFGDVIKEDIILDRYIDAPSFEFELKLGKGLSAEIEKNVVLVYNGVEEEPVFCLSAPSMTDASGVVSAEIVQTLRKEKGKTILTVTPDGSWLSDLSRAYPVKIDPTITINDNRLYLTMVCNVSPNSHNNDAQNGGGALVGFDDGLLSGSGYWPFGLCRLYAKLDYDFSSIPLEASIDSATFSLYQTRAMSGGTTKITLSEVDTAWDELTITWNSQPLSHTFIGLITALPTDGIVTWDVRDTVEDWVQGLSDNNGFVLKSSPEGTTQCEEFRAVSNPAGMEPTLVINWSVPDPVPETTGINDTTVILRPIAEKAVDGKLTFDGVFADGLAKPGSIVDYRLLPDDIKGVTPAYYSYKYPDSSEWTDPGQTYENGTRYKYKLSNWQTGLFNGLDFDILYKIAGKATYPVYGSSPLVGSENESEPFLVYLSKQFDTIPNIAKHYGVPLDTVMRDNRVQDTLIVEGNTVFIRNPNDVLAYNPPALTDDTKREVDAALMGRGLHCEFGFEPVNMTTGNFYMEQTDAVIPDIEGDFSILRSYNSIGDSYQNVFGRRWGFSYAESLSLAADGTIFYVMGDGRKLYFHPDGSGGYISPAGYYLDLERISYTITNLEGNLETVYRYEMKSPDGALKKFNAWGLLTSVTSALGLETNITYDADYNIKSIKSPAGKEYTFTSDAYGRFSTITQPDGGVMSYDYDVYGNLIKYTDATGGVTEYFYDSESHMTEWKDPNGNSVAKNVYDTEGRVLEQYDAEGNVVTLSYTMDTVTATDAKGYVTVYTFDAKKRPVKIEYPDGEVTLREYSADNMLTRDGDMRFEYDGLGNRTKEIRLDNSFKEYEYGPGCLPVKVRDYNGLVTEFEYSATGDLIKTTRADGAFETLEYDAYHRPVKLTAIDGTVNTFTYSGAVITSWADAEGNVWEYGYDLMNRRVSVKDPIGNVSRTMYDMAGRITSEQAPDGGLVSFGLDPAGNAISVTDARGYKTEAVINSRNEIIKSTDPLGNTLTFSYDKNGNLRTETDAKGNITGYSYDSRNRLSRKTGPTGAFLEYSYDTKGRLTEQRDERGASLHFSYSDVLNLPVSAKDQDGNVTKYSYNAVGRLLSVEYPDGTKEEFSYLLSGNLSSYIDSLGKETEFTYTGRDYIKSLKENGSRTYSYEYDLLGNVKKAVDPLGSETLFEYDKRSRLTKRTDPLGASSKFEYDENGRLKKYTDANGGAAEIEYDRSGNVLSVKDANGGVTEFVYNEICLLVSEIDAEGNVTNFGYDANENLISVKNALGGEKLLTYSPLNLPLTLTDENGHMSEMKYDISGNLTDIILANGDALQLFYDALSRPKAEIDAAGLRTDFSYDSMGRVQKSWNTVGDSLEYFYDVYGRPYKIEDALGRTEENEYNSFSEIVKQKTFDGDVTVIDYDALGRPVKALYENGSYISAAFDAAGNLSEQRGRNGGVYTYSHDAVGNVISSKDPLGGVASYFYDAMGNLTGVTDENGAHTAYEYDKLSRLVRSESALGNEYTWSYDALSRLIKEKSPEGGVWGYFYDSTGSLIKEEDPSGNITEYVYDEVKRLVKEIAPMGGEKLYEYDPAGRLISETDPLGNRTEYTVTLDGLVTSMKLPNGGVFDYTYDLAKRVKSVTSPLGLEREFSYDSRGNLASETDNLGRTSTYSYNVMHDLTDSVNPMGISTSLSYDEAGNLKSILSPNGGVTSFDYDLLGRAVKTENALGQETELGYDPSGSLTSVTLPGSRAIGFSYDAEGKNVSVTDPLGNVSMTGYDRDGRVISETDALGGVMAYSYDPAGRLTGFTDQLGALTSFSYDGDGNVTKVDRGAFGSTKFGYDLAGNLTAVTDPAGRLTTYEYNELYCLTKVIDAGSGVTEYSYDLMGNLTSITNPAGEVKAFAYDISGRLSQAVSPSGDKVSYDFDKLNELVAKTYTEDSRQNVMYMYDSEGNRSAMDDVGGHTSYEYDLLGRLTKVTGEDGKAIRYAYGENGQISGITYADGTAVSYGYDKNDNLISVTDGSGTAKYSYDALGRPVSLVRADGITTEYEYNGKGGLTKLKNTDAAGSLISSFSYEFDALGRIVKEAETGAAGGTTTRLFSYSLSGELSVFSESSPFGNMKYEYFYDDTGNRTEQKKTSLTSSETIYYSYDGAGRLTRELSTVSGETLYSYDSDGNLVKSSGAGGQTTYEYTVENRLKAVREGGRLLMAASYDGDGNRVLQINLRSKNTDIPYHYQNKGAGNIRRGALSESENEEKTLPGAAAPGAAPIGPEDGQGAEPEKDTSGNMGRGINAFLYGILSYLKALFMPLMPYTLEELAADSLPDSGGTGADVNWYRETAVTADQKSSDKKRIEALGLSPGEISSIQNARIPDVYTGIRYEDTYELTRYVNDVNLKYTQALMEYNAAEKLNTKYTYGLERLSTSNAAAAGVRGQQGPASYIMNGNGSVSALMAQGAGRMLASYSYGAYGETAATAYDKYGNAASYMVEESFYGYNGESYDSVTDLQYLRARYYDPLMGRFHVADTYLGNLLDPLSQNLYTYTQGDPINFTDPSGHGILSTIGGLVKTAVTAVYNTVVKPVATFVYNNVVKPVATFVYNTFVQPVTQKLATASTWVANNASNPVIKTLGYAGAAVFNVIGGNTSDAQIAYHQAVQYAQTFTQELSARVNRVFCTTADRVQTSSGEGTSRNISLLKGLSKPGSPGPNEPGLDLSGLAFLAKAIGISPTKENKNIYSSTDFALQPAFGWNKGFNIVHDVFTLNKNKDEEFFITVKNEYGFDEKIAFIVWKGNYLNLGAGVEIGSYSQTAYQSTDYGIGRKFDMSVSLTTKGVGEDTILFGQGFKNTRWNNAFMPSYQNPVVDALTATGTVRFNENEIDIYNAFVEKYKKDERVEIDPYNPYTIIFKV